MEVKKFIPLAMWGLQTVIFKGKRPILGTIILTDKCNLSCKHCAVNNIKTVIYPHKQIKEEMKLLYDQGVRLLFLCGGEIFLWKDGQKTLRDVVREAKEMGFLFVTVVTNGTFALDLEEADLILVSLDGDREKHNLIRGNTFDVILKNIRQSPHANICLYMAINNLNKDDIPAVCELGKTEPNVRAVSFNFHTPYPGTEDLSLTRDEKVECLNVISQHMKKGYPILNLKSAFPYIATNNFPTPCHHCLILENGHQWTCGRCIDIEGLCENCGYFFAAEYSLAFNGNLKVCFDLVKTYWKYI